MTREEMCTEKKKTACLAASLSTNTTPCQSTSATTPVNKRETNKRREPWDQTLPHTSLWVRCSFSTTCGDPLQVRQNILDLHATVWKSTPSRRTKAFLQQVEQPGTAQPRIEVLVVALKAMIKDILFSKDGEQEKPLVRFTKMNRSQLADKARQLQLPTSENDMRRQLISIMREDLMQQNRKKSDNLGFGMNGAKTHQEVLHVNHQYFFWGRPNGGSAISPEAQEVQMMAEDAKRVPEFEPDEQHKSRTDDTKHQATRGREALRRNASLETTRQTPQDARTEKSQPSHSSGGRKPLAEGTISEVVGTIAVADVVLKKSVERRARQRALRNGSCSQEEHSDEHNESRRDELDGRTRTMQYSWACVKPFDQANRTGAR